MELKELAASSEVGWKFDFKAKGNTWGDPWLPHYMGAFYHPRFWLQVKY